MEGFIIIAGIAWTVIFFVVLYFVINAAVRNAIVEALHAVGEDDAPDENGGDAISQVICTSCGKSYDMDYPRCPYCRRHNLFS